METGPVPVLILQVLKGAHMDDMDGLWQRSVVRPSVGPSPGGFYPSSGNRVQLTQQRGHCESSADGFSSLTSSRG